MKTESLKSGGRRPVPTSDDVPLTEEQIPLAVEDVLTATQFVDIHTHLYPPAFGKVGLWGIDELLTYHYLEAEFFRSSSTTPQQYWALSKQEQAEAIWRALFIENTPVSEATRGVIAVLQAFQLPTDRSGLAEARAFFKAQTLGKFLSRKEASPHHASTPGPISTTKYVAGVVPVFLIPCSSLERTNPTEPGPS